LKKILYLTFYFEPDLCAGSFRNTPLAKELAKQFGEENEIVVITTKPNRYNTFKVEAPLFEKKGNITIHRIAIPEHASGFVDQILSFYTFYTAAWKIVKKQRYDLVFASSSRLFTAFLGYRVASAGRTRLYLDIRDIFTDTMKDVLKNRLLKMMVLPVLRFIEKKTFSNATHINLISAGFAPYFNKYPKPAYSFYSNGIDDEFIKQPPTEKNDNWPRKIIYAGNIGEGQGLHIIVPAAAKILGDRYEFLIVGDGGAKNKLAAEIKRLNVTNVKMIDPVKRSDVIDLYKESHFFFIHLNDYDAFKKVLPSKIFELAAYDKPIIAGVSGYAREFLETNVSNTIVFSPGDVDALVQQISSYSYGLEERTVFKQKFMRSNLNAQMVASILMYSA
jgi:glycosyltransferase involved in cell wall biosynthesis